MALFAVILLVTLVPTVTSANSAPPRRLGDKAGVLLPGVSSQVHVKRETLVFDLDEEYRSAEVTARYEMENRGAALAKYPVIFVAQNAGYEADESIKVSWNGAPLTVRPVTPEGLPAGDLQAMEREWTAMHEVINPVTQERYTTEDFYGGVDLQFAQFDLNLPAGASGTLEVQYKHEAIFEESQFVNPQYHYQYLLLPAKAWASFGPLEITIKTPGRQPYFASTLPFSYANGEFKASFPGLPQENLAFGVMSRRGVWFGWTEESTYVGIAFLLLLLLAVPVGLLTGRLGGLVSKRGWAVVVGILSGLLLGGGLNLVLVFVVIALIPGLQGNGYTPLLVGVGSWFLSLFVSMLFGGIAAARRHRQKFASIPGG